MPDERRDLRGAILAGLLLTAALALASCRAPLWLGPETAVAWTPDAAMVRALRDTNDLCAGRVLSRPPVEWYVVPGGAFWSPAGEVLGYWTSDQRIYIADTDTLRHWVLRHELLHASLGTGHPPVFETCGVMP